MNRLFFGIIILLAANAGVAAKEAPKTYTCSLENWETRKTVSFQFPVGCSLHVEIGDPSSAVVQGTAYKDGACTGLYLQIRDAKGRDIYAETAVSGFPEKIHLSAYNPGATVTCIGN